MRKLENNKISQLEKGGEHGGNATSEATELDLQADWQQTLEDVTTVPTTNKTVCPI